MPPRKKMHDPRNKGRRLRIRRMHRCVAVGDQFIEGPTALFPPLTIDDYGWLEPQLRITLVHGWVKKHESISVYVDCSMNRNEGFLSPILRYCSWNREADMHGQNTWPSIQVRLGKMKDQSEVSSLMIGIQRGLTGIRFEPVGLQPERNEPNVNDEPQYPSYSLYLWNACQQIDYTSRSIAGDTLKPQVFATFNALLGAMVEVDKQGWRERFDHNLKPESSRKDWEWIHENAPHR